VWPDFPVQLHVDGSCVTVKADAARRSFNAYGDRVVWAVVDTGIAGGHPHFSHHRTLDHDDVADLHRDFTVDGEPTVDGALVDAVGHGTHVAGIIAGAVAPWLLAEPGRAVRAVENRYNPANPRRPMAVPRDVDEPELLAGIAPRARLVSLKALKVGGTLDDRVNRVIAALAYVRQVNGEGADGMRIHGVNLSVGYEFDPEWFACGRSPLCSEVDKVVRSGVVVVVAAGNSGYGSINVRSGAPTKFGLGMTINDPGNAERAITVGSTHRDAPHAYGVSFFSSKGPTGDGRASPTSSRRGSGSPRARRASGSPRCSPATPRRTRTSTWRTAARSFALGGLFDGPPPVGSVTLLQGAFSHFAFADPLPFDANRRGALAGMLDVGGAGGRRHRVGAPPRFAAATCRSWPSNHHGWAREVNTTALDATDEGRQVALAEGLCGVCTGTARTARAPQQGVSGRRAAGASRRGPGCARRTDHPRRTRSASRRAPRRRRRPPARPASCGRGTRCSARPRSPGT
jgi:hypothetical protein